MQHLLWLTSIPKTSSGPSPKRRAPGSTIHVGLAVTIITRHPRARRSCTNSAISEITFWAVETKMENGRAVNIDHSTYWRQVSWTENQIRADCPHVWFLLSSFAQMLGIALACETLIFTQPLPIGFRNLTCTYASRNFAVAHASHGKNSEIDVPRQVSADTVNCDMKKTDCVAHDRFSYCASDT